MKIIEGTITEISQPMKNFWGRTFIRLKIDGKDLKIKQHERVLFSCVANSGVNDKVTIKLNFRGRMCSFTTNSLEAFELF